MVKIKDWQENKNKNNIYIKRQFKNISHKY